MSEYECVSSSLKWRNRQVPRIQPCADWRNAKWRKTGEKPSENKPLYWGFRAMRSNSGSIRRTISVEYLPLRRMPAIIYARGA